MSTAFFPYATMSGDIELVIKDLKIDGRKPSPAVLVHEAVEKKISELVDEEDKSWRTVKLLVEVIGPVEELRRFEETGKVGAVVTIRCKDTLERRSMALRRASPESGRWSRWIELQREDFRGCVELRAILTGVAGGVDHRFLGTSNSWRVYFDDCAFSAKSGAIRIRWVDFQNDPAYPHLRSVSGEPYFVELDDDMPVLFLNKGEGYRLLPILLGDRPRRGQDLDLHNAERVGIARGIWTAMLNASMAGIRMEEGEEEPSWPESDWQEKVLRQFLPRIYKQGAAEALKSALEDWRAGDLNLIESRGQLEINRTMLAGKKLKKALSTITISASDATEGSHE